MPVTKEEVLSALKQCYDPEIPVNIVDLGLIYAISITTGAADTALPRTAFLLPPVPEKAVQTFVQLRDLSRFGNRQEE